MSTKTEITFEGILENANRTPYGSIIMLTVHYQGEHGLRLLHYRWALLKEKDCVIQVNKGMHRFFGKKLEQLRLLNDIRNDITSRANLVKYLNNLVAVGILYKDSVKHSEPTYRITPEKYHKIDTFMRRKLLIQKVLNEIENCPDEQLTDIEKKLDKVLDFHRYFREDFIMKNVKIEKKK